MALKLSKWLHLSSVKLIETYFVTTDTVGVAAIKTVYTFLFTHF